MFKQSVAKRLDRLNERVYALEQEKSTLEKILEEKYNAQDVLNNKRNSSLLTLVYGSPRSYQALERLADFIMMELAPKKKGKK